MLNRRMVRLLEKLIIQRDGIHCRYGISLRYTQDQLFEGRKASDHIVDIDRHYIRPVVEGKEIQSVEFIRRSTIDSCRFSSGYIWQMPLMTEKSRTDRIKRHEFTSKIKRNHQTSS